MHSIPANDCRISFDSVPGECPYCHKAITPEIRAGFVDSGKNAQIFMSCPDKKCQRCFIGYFSFYSVISAGSPPYYKVVFTGNVSQGTLQVKAFPDIIEEKYPGFTEIFREAFIAEQQRLLEICGVGYRKSLEFLIKDYCIELNPDKKNDIEKRPLNQVIEHYVNEPRIQSVAKRAVWLGNDETHYIKKWEGRDLKDLKTLIDLTIRWIEMEVLTRSFEEEMPHP